MLPVSSGLTIKTRRQAQPIDPYYVLMQLPGEATPTEFALILPFTPSNRNNMIGWMAGRSDGEHYGKLLVYNFPESRLIEGPLQIEARIDQNAATLGPVQSLEPTRLARASRTPPGYPHWTVITVCGAGLPSGAAQSYAGVAPRRARDSGTRSLRTEF